MILVGVDAPQAWLERYRSAFARGDLDVLVGCFAFPLHVVSVIDETATVSVARCEDWLGVLKDLLGAYERLGVTDAVPLASEVSEPMDAVAVVRVQWALQRTDGERIYDFRAMYTLARTGSELRVVAIAHDESPKLQAAMRAV